MVVSDEYYGALAVDLTRLLKNLLQATILAEDGAVLVQVRRQVREIYCKTELDFPSGQEWDECPCSWRV